MAITSIQIGCDRRALKLHGWQTDTLKIRWIDAAKLEAAALFSCKQEVDKDVEELTWHSYGLYSSEQRRYISVCRWRSDFHLRALTMAPHCEIHH